MIEPARYAALALLILVSHSATSQEDEPAPPAAAPASEELEPSMPIPDVPDQAASADNELTLTGPPADDLEQTVPVSDEDIDEGIDDGLDYFAEELSDQDALLAEFARFKQLMADNVLDEADTVGKRIVELSIRTHGSTSNEFAKALTNLAIVQYQSEQYDAAVQNFETAIGIIEDNEDRLNEQLVNPLKGLGAAQLESGRPDLASLSFGRAVHVTHVNEGPHNLDQIDLLESIAESHVRMGNLDSAKAAQDRIYALNVRRYELDAPELVPALMRRAAWQHRAGFIFDERASYRRAIRIIEEHKGKDALELVEPLILLGRSYFYIDTTGAQSFHDSNIASGEIYFRRATRISAEHPDAEWQTITQASLALGDYYLYNNNPQRGRQVYATVWALLSEETDGEQSEAKLSVRREELERVVTLKQNKLPLYINSETNGSPDDSENPLLEGRVSVSYGVSTRGRATGLKLIEAEPAEFQDMINFVSREIRRRIYRPRFEDGVALESTDLMLDHRYFYRQTDLDAVIAENSAKAN